MRAKHHDGIWARASKTKTFLSEKLSFSDESLCKHHAVNQRLSAGVRRIFIEICKLLLYPQGWLE